MLLITEQSKNYINQPAVSGHATLDTLNKLALMNRLPFMGSLSDEADYRLIAQIMARTHERLTIYLSCTLH